MSNKVEVSTSHLLPMGSQVIWSLDFMKQVDFVYLLFSIYTWEVYYNS